MRHTRHKTSEMVRQVCETPLICFVAVQLRVYIFEAKIGELRLAMVDKRLFQASGVGFRFARS